MNVKKTSIVFMLLIVVSCMGEVAKPTGNIVQQEEYSTYSIEGLELNAGEKWVTDKETSIGFRKMLDLVNGFSEHSNPIISDYNNFGDQMDGIKGEVLTQCTMTGVGHDHLHTLLMPLIRKINGIKEIDNAEKAAEIFSNIKLNVELYDEYFKY